MDFFLTKIGEVWWPLVVFDWPAQRGDLGMTFPFELADIDGLESSAIGGQLMASASMESPFTQSRRIDDSTVAGKTVVYLAFNINTHDTCYQKSNCYMAA